MSSLSGNSNDPGTAGATGENDSSQGVGVLGLSSSGDGVRAVSRTGNGVSSFSDSNVAVFANAATGDGVVGVTGSPAKSGVFGSNTATAPASSPGGSGVFGLTVAPGAAGVFGANNATAGRGVQGNGPEVGVGGFSQNGVAVLAQSAHVGIKAQAPLAGRFEGDVEVTGDIRLVNGDCAEDFDVAWGTIPTPGTVVSLAPDGAVGPSLGAYDTRVAGVVAGAGRYQPAIVLDRHDDPRESDRPRVPVALFGKVICKVDASTSPIRAGDLLTTSEREGYAMAASPEVDRGRLVGAVIGKALAGLADGLGELPVLVGLK